LSGIEEAKIVRFAMNVAREMDTEWVAVALAWPHRGQFAIWEGSKKAVAAQNKDWLMRKHWLENE
jgi:hypothetical protein